MKKLLYICFVLFISSCNSQDKKEDKKTVKAPTSIKHNTMNTQYDYKKLIDDKTEHFDIKYFDKHKDEAENLIYTDKFGNDVSIFGDNKNGYFNNSTPKNSLFTIYKEFSPKGTILRKWVNFRNGGGPVGIKYEYDDSGKLIKKTDMDKGYIITADDIINYCKKNEIDLFSDYTHIDKNYDEGSRKLYLINYRGKYEGKFAARIIIAIDGSNGNILKVTAINGKHNDSMDVLYEKK
ncbi:hypothetical protein [Chryseobacterium gallinarum]|uniref:Lipoprotein n=1 Tax=Chryseobacterium gallinarum TaxID=1324352 RepID=A0ABX6KQY8_CHRGL|nr:hypothetical protein [Chryseobacterium gallinarum]QIY91037.1 hypothetical protein FOB44_10425 [Chryseobacterium gallinarum]